MTLEEQFYENLQKWEEHCQSSEVIFNCSHQALKNCESYKNLVAMGKDILPYIKEVYETRIHEDSALIFNGLVGLVGEIAEEEFKIPEEIRGKVGEMRDYTIGWLETNLQK